MKKIIPLFLGMLLPLCAVADQQSDIQLLKDNMAKEMADVVVDDVQATPVTGLYQLTSGSRIFYLTPDLKYAFRGSLIDLDNQVDITAEEQGKLSMKFIEKLGDEKMVVFGPKEGKAERTITVFTDTSCPYCARLHEEVPQLNEAGIRVRYLLYPRAGIGSDAYKVLQSAWCAEDKQQALSDAKNGKNIEEKSCDNPIAETIQLAREVGLQGTPLIFTDAGVMVSGYRPANILIESVKSSKPL
ncbi:MAG: DsbC family protein [Chromatiales bacterium]|nr:DsbC family protein [Chromatiales bacterium]